MVMRRAMALRSWMTSTSDAGRLWMLLRLALSAMLMSWRFSIATLVRSRSRNVTMWPGGTGLLS